MLPDQVLKTLGLLETYMVVNFRTRRINQSTRKLARTFTLIKKKKVNVWILAPISIPQSLLVGLISILKSNLEVGF
jgi:hypothetical protein